MKLSAADLKSLSVFLAVTEHRGFAGAQTALHETVCYQFSYSCS